MTAVEGPRKRFAVDVMLGKLAKWLRVLGFDAPSLRIEGKEHVPALLAEGFVPLTRNRGLRETPGVLFINSDRPIEQLEEVIVGLGIGPGDARLLHRCLVCNAVLKPAPRREVFGSVPDFIFETHVNFFSCAGCDRVYWPGSHRGRMIERIELITGWNGLDKKED